ncbi:MAG: ankyrin repeat domain-containing protein [Acidobacteriaceae bacterium]|nr:ankyrin repeat domain-containing protein [Acidobacteriaceae bacterium]
MSVAALAEAVKAGDLAQVRSLLHARPELIGMDLAENDEHRALHYAVLRRDLPMVRLLMEAGADARKGIFPHRDATSAFALARDREYHDVVAIIEEEERLRRDELSCPNATVSPVQDEISAAIMRGERDIAIRLLEANTSLIQACDREGWNPLHVAAQAADRNMVAWLLEHGAKTNKIDMRGLTALDRAALSASPRNRKAERFPAVARELLEHGAEMTIRGAVALADVSRIRELVEADGKLLRQIDRDGGLLSIAANHNQVQAVRLLLDLGADVDEKVMLEELEEPTPSWGFPLWYAALAGQRDIVQLLLERGADPNANVYASGWPLRNAWDHPDPSVKELLLEHGAKREPYMIAEQHDIVEASRMLAAEPSENLARDFAVSAADHGCPAILELALPLIKSALDDPAWHWILIQPIRGAGGDSSDNEGHFRSMQMLLSHGVDGQCFALWRNRTAFRGRVSRSGERP